MPPKISIITPSKNTGRFIKETVQSILDQSFKDWEHIVVDGGSVDETFEILKAYPHIRIIQKSDNIPEQAFGEGLKIVQGEYVMFCPFSDGYLNKNWLKICAELLDNEPMVSLVWGIDQNMKEDGTLDRIVYHSFFDCPPPSGKDFFFYWLKSHTLFHERDMCVRTNVMKDCFPNYDQVSWKVNGFLEFFYQFNSRGYLSHFLPVLAAYGRHHQSSSSERLMKDSNMLSQQLTQYSDQITVLKKILIKNSQSFQFRNGQGQVLDKSVDVKRGLRLIEQQLWIQKLKQLKKVFGQ